MAIRGRAITGYRDVVIEFSNAHDTVDGSEVAQIAAPIDAFKAAIREVERIEADYALRGAPAVGDLADATVYLTGAQNDFRYEFTVTSTMATGNYEFLFVAASQLA